jgi:hypothetical protein
MSDDDRAQFIRGPGGPKAARDVATSANPARVRDPEEPQPSRDVIERGLAACRAALNQAKAAR